ncbi:hypothetical protein BJ741DRAFT_625655 [Chytriomyces cf. hyalinus JEL632]|nr:hypothetical protein BJ741DRAFT_625655 [Chytriomyces cf. hyalinus JEL632]
MSNSSTESGRIEMDKRQSVAYVHTQCLLGAVDVGANADETAAATNFVTAMFNTAARNLCVDGYVWTPESMHTNNVDDEEVAPYDNDVRQQREDALHEYLAARKRVAELRESVPEKACNAVLRKLEPEVRVKEKSESESVELSLGRMKRAAEWLANESDELALNETRSRNIMNSLSMSAPEALEKWKRAKIVIGDMCAVTASKPPPIVMLGTPSRLSKKTALSDASNQLTPRKTRAEFLKLLH